MFTAGEDQEIEVLLAVLQDSTCEDQEEVFSVRLVSSDVSVLLGELDTSNVTIEEDDSTLSCSHYNIILSLIYVHVHMYRFT